MPGAVDEEPTGEGARFLRAGCKGSRDGRLAGRDRSTACGA